MRNQAESPENDGGALRRRAETVEHLEKRLRNARTDEERAKYRRLLDQVGRTPETRPRAPHRETR